MGRIYFYKMIVDNGGAPCVDGGLLSLAICKPRIRTSARPGDLVFGFAAKSMDPENRLIYIASVTDVVEDGRYFREPSFSHREDCVYGWTGDRFLWKPGSKHHRPADLIHDLGPHPDYPRASVLLSFNYRYFGSTGTAEYRRRYPLVAEAVAALGRGHRVHHGEELKSQLLALKEQVWKQSDVAVLGQPTSRPRCGVSHRSRACGVIGDVGD